ncbi:Glycosyl transferase, group 2 [Lactiplantibacillus plantarum]|uniref:glycosyltransferase n=1 Tax=Lactiplantibacillus plantarum TaxID=1590 RepID=UPI0004DD5966|nr:glycosyltransferase [Lactiplantibacillus plantarum]KEZ14729.1 Glycosyl transferase, group 2 [Lactiplantibacillus plantarum]
MAYLQKKELTVLIVTYQDHRVFLRETLTKLQKHAEFVENVIIVQNGAEYNIHNFVESLSIPELTFITITNSENQGSAGGFGIGIEKYQAIGAPKLLILDDDNYIPNETFGFLKNLDDKKVRAVYGEKIAISLYRPQHDMDVTRFQREQDVNEHFFENTVHKFSVMHKLHSSKNYTQRPIREICETYIAPYSGIILEKQDIVNLEPIQRLYYVYGDDTRFTIMMSRAGIRILKFKQAVSVDLEQSWYQNNTKQNGQEKSDVQLMLETDNVNKLWRPYYQIRNGVYTGKQLFKKNNSIFYLNLLIYCVMPFFVYMPKTKAGLRNYRFFLSAVFCGLFGKMGEINQKMFEV